jgi:acetoacetate decarboxylase
MGGYTHAMFLDTHPPIAGGRELWGFPQKLATPVLKVERDTLVGTLDFGPIRIAVGTMEPKLLIFRCRSVVEDLVARCARPAPRRPHARVSASAVFRACCRAWKRDGPAI